MPRKKTPPVYAERGANPAQVALKVPEDWPGEHGRIARAARAKGFPTAAEYHRQRLDAALKADGF